MGFATYTELKTSIASYLGRSDLTSVIPDFITFAEIRLAREIRTRQTLKSATATMTAADSTIGLPTDFLEMRDIFTQGNPRNTISYLSPSLFSRNARAGESGLPVYYTIIGDEIQFAPIPDSAYVLEMLYYYKPTPLSTSVATNEYLANFPDALLYASLAEAEPYLMNDARVQTWATLYDRATSDINGSDESSEYAGVPLTMQLTSR
jgi:hypothetical protein